MKISTVTAALALSAFASSAIAQNVTTADGHIVMVEKNQTATVATPAATGPAVGAAAPVTGFVPLTGAALGAAGPLALGLGAIIAIGAISGGEGT